MASQLFNTGDCGMQQAHLIAQCTTGCTCFYGKGALELIKANKFDDILLDLHMPKMDDLEVLRNLRANSLTSTLLVVIISNAADMRNVEQARQLGALGYLRKPFRVDGIAKAIEAATSGKSISQRLSPPK